MIVVHEGQVKSEPVAIQVSYIAITLTLDEFIVRFNIVEYNFDIFIN